MSGLKYQRDELIRLNVYGLRTIPVGQHYDSLRQFVSEEAHVNLASVVRAPMIPTYLKNRYGNIHVPSNMIVRGQYREGTGGTRHKLYNPVIETHADQINEEIRDLLSKLSDTNKDKIFDKLMTFDIPDQCGQSLIDTLYLFAVDLAYLVHLYAEFILRLGDKNKCLYEQLIQKIKDTGMQPLSTDVQAKRLRLGNLFLTNELAVRAPSSISYEHLMHLVQFYLSQTTPEMADYLQLVCEILKPLAKKGVSDDLLEQLHSYANNHQYEKRIRFMVQDTLELFQSEDEDDDDV